MNFLLAGKYLVLLIALGSILIGLIVFITKKPLIINSAYRNLSIVPLLIAAYFATGDEEFIISNIVILFLLIALITIISFAFKGITILGSADERLQNLTAEDFTEKGIEFDQIPTTIYIKKSKVILSFSTITRYGISGISFKGNARNTEVNELIKELRRKNLLFSSYYPVYAFVSGAILLFLYFIQR